jgi:hypothetical protein
MRGMVAPMPANGAIDTDLPSADFPRLLSAGHLQG